MDHKHTNGGHKDFCTCHSDNGSSRSRDAVNLDRDRTFVIHQHIVDLSRRNAITAGAVNPNGDVSAAGLKLFSEKLWCDVIVKPTFLCDGAVEVQSSHCRSCLRLLLIRPIPKLLHRVFPPFRYQ